MENFLYATDIAIPAAVGTVVGYGIGFVGDLMHNKIFPAAARLDEKVGKIMVDVGGKAGEKTIAIDKKVGSLWDKILGRSEDDKIAWRKEHGIPEPKYLEKVDGKPRSDEVPELQPSHYTSTGLMLGLLAGTAYGACKGFGKWVDRKREKRKIYALEEQTKLLEKSLSKRYIPEDEVSP